MKRSIRLRDSLYGVVCPTLYNALVYPIPYSLPDHAASSIQTEAMHLLISYSCDIIVDMRSVDFSIELGGANDAVEIDPGDFPQKLTAMVNDAARDEFGDSALLDPSDVMLSPVMGPDERLFMVTGWHTTADNKGIFQRTTLQARMSIIGEDAYLFHEEGNRNYPLSTREFAVLASLANVAFAQTIVSALE